MIIIHYYISVKILFIHCEWLILLIFFMCPSVAHLHSNFSSVAANHQVLAEGTGQFFDVNITHLYVSVKI